MSTKHSIQPTEDRVLITPEAGEEKTEGGIFIPKEAQEKSQIGHIIAVGPGTKDNPMQRKVNERVVYSKYGGTEIKLHGQEYLILRTSDILAVLA